MERQGVALGRTLLRGIQTLSPDQKTPSDN
jgi:hypothetical protein